MSQVQRLLLILLDGEPHSSFDLVSEVYGTEGPSLARLGARIADIKNMGHAVRSWQDKENKKKWWYQVHQGTWSFNGERVV